MREEAHTRALSSASRRQSQLDNELQVEQARQEAVADQMREEALMRAQQATEQRHDEHEAVEAAARAKEEELRDVARAAAEAVAEERRVAAEVQAALLRASLQTTKVVEHCTVSLPTAYCLLPGAFLLLHSRRRSLPPLGSILSFLTSHFTPGALTSRLSARSGYPKSTRFPRHSHRPGCDPRPGAEVHVQVHGTAHRQRWLQARYALL